MAARPRPLSALKGKRKVPVLVSANKIPFLRFGKPQPETLSRYFKSRVVQRQRRMDRRERLEELLGVARAEDAWDGLVRRLGVRDGDGGGGKGKGRLGMEGSWGVEVEGALREVKGLMEREGEKNRRMAEVMVGIVDGERALAEKERKERVRVRNMERRKRKEEREKAKTGVGKEEK